MNNMDLKINASNLNNRDNIRKVKESDLKKFRDNLVELVKNGSTPHTSVLEHGIWQVCNERMLDKISVDKLKNSETESKIPVNSDMYKAMKAYTDRIEEAVDCGLIEKPKWLVYKKSL